MSKNMAIGLICFISLIAISTVTSAQDPWEDYPWDTTYGDETALLFGLGLTVCLILVLVPLIIGILACIWLYKDAEKRGKQGALWVILLILAAIFLSFLGLIIVIIIWLVIRPPIGGEKPAAVAPAEPDRRCPNCGRGIPMDARTCPYCGKNFESSP